MKRIKDRFIRMFIMGFRQLQDPYYHGFAAQVAFYLMLSIVPIFILIVQILGLFNISIGTVLILFEEYTGGRVPDFVSSLFHFSSLGFGNIIYLIIASWAGSRASFALTRIANYTFTEGGTTGRNYFIERIRAVKTLAITVFTVVFSILILSYGKLILSGVISIIGKNPEDYVDSIWMWLRWPLGFLLYFAMISYNFYVLPTAEKKPFRKVIPGSILASVGLLFVTGLYSAYTGTLAKYDIVYGALSSVVAILIWFFLLSWVMLLGILCNKVWDDTTEPFTKRKPPEHLERARHFSKFDTDPDEFGITIIKDILTGDDQPEIDWTQGYHAEGGKPADAPESKPADTPEEKSSGGPEGGEDARS